MAAAQDSRAGQSHGGSRFSSRSPKKPAGRRSASPRTRRILAAALAVMAVALLAWALFGGPAGTYMSYPDFMDELEAGNVATATIGDGRVDFTLRDGTGTTAGDATSDAPSDGDSVGFPAASHGATSYYTDNPERDGFKERLLLAGVEVGSAAGADDVFNLVLDVLFYAFFFGTVGAVAVSLVRHSRNTFKVVRRTGVTFADVAGMEGPKRELRRLVEVLKDPAGYAKRGVRPVKGVILEGPPGNGKTLFARALAQEAGVNFIATKGADFQSAFMSLGARKIRMLFAKAARHKPCIVFIDEFDSIGERRNYAGTGIDKENNRIITAMLNEMDGFAANDGILVVAATNSYRSLDPALVRPGRFDVKLTVGNPDAATRRELVELYTQGRGRALDPSLSPEELVAAFEGLSCAAIETCLNGAAAAAMEADGTSGAGARGGAITMELVRAAAEKADVRLKERS